MRRPVSASSWLKRTVFRETGEQSFTGTLTSPKVMAPLHIDRAMGPIVPKRGRGGTHEAVHGDAPVGLVAPVPAHGERREHGLRGRAARVGEPQSPARVDQPGEQVEQQRDVAALVERVGGKHEVPRCALDDRLGARPVDQRGLERRAVRAAFSSSSSIACGDQSVASTRPPASAAARLEARARSRARERARPAASARRRGARARRRSATARPSRASTPRVRRRARRGAPPRRAGAAPAGPRRAAARSPRRSRRTRLGRPPAEIAASSSSRELELGRAGRVGDALGPARARDRDDGRALRQQPRERDLLRGDAVRLGRRRARRRRVPVESDLPMPPSGDHGMNAIPRSVQASTSPLASGEVKPSESWGKTEDDLGDPECLLELLDGCSWRGRSSAPCPRPGAP